MVVKIEKILILLDEKKGTGKLILNLIKLFLLELINFWFFRVNLNISVSIKSFI